MKLPLTVRTQSLLTLVLLTASALIFARAHFTTFRRPVPAWPHTVSSDIVDGSTSTDAGHHSQEQHGVLEERKPGRYHKGNIGSVRNFLRSNSRPLTSARSNFASTRTSRIVMLSAVPCSVSAYTMCTVFCKCMNKLPVVPDFTQSK
ncbi:hypothetical protein M011DRAFT_469542 [Sporormia fimetaria CBS 119925]|uniref:Uncharacterized protein n=1 Tax=Sporormia fimetaria CBS 119925 TaxID=1340428 RepID=A0A6A6V8L7_9PLEO|nr:hypothetical protein M011DRAFT_469542 [Sporormia fimetaria CBS 119925]